MVVELRHSFVVVRDKIPTLIVELHHTWGRRDDAHGPWCRRGLVSGLVVGLLFFLLLLFRRSHRRSPGEETDRSASLSLTLISGVGRALSEQSSQLARIETLS
jgi:hypothetical protein